MKQNKLNPFLVREQLGRKNIRIFTPEEFRRLFNVPAVKAKYFLETYVRKGLFARLKKGLYTFKNQLPSEEEIANALYRPSYISFEYALARYGIIPEMVYSITSATTMPTRRFSFGTGEFEYLAIKKSAFSEYYLAKEGDKNFLIAEPEKALADYLYFVSLGRKTPIERMNIKNIKKEKLIAHAKLFKRKSILLILKKIYDQPPNNSNIGR